MVKFDHSKTAFPLQGQHAQVQCVQCHGAGKWLVGGVQTVSQLTAQSFKQTPTDCAGCHAEPAVHKGMFDSNCATCHTTDGWKPARMDGKLFDHTSTTGFSLALHAKNYDGTLMTCKACHQNGIDKFDPQTCETCHAQGAERAAFMRQACGPVWSGLPGLSRRRRSNEQFRPCQFLCIGWEACQDRM